MNKKLIAVAVVALFAIAAYAQTVEHSKGVIIFNKDKILNAKNVCDGGATCIDRYAKNVGYYTINSAYPTTFVASGAYDAGCNVYSLTENAKMVSGQVSGKPLHCIIDTPVAALDAGAKQVFKAADGGYIAGACGSIDLNATVWPAFCFVTNGSQP